VDSDGSDDVRMTWLIDSIKYDSKCYLWIVSLDVSIGSEQVFDDEY